MRRPAAIVAAVACALAAAGPAFAGEASGYLTWPGKTGVSAPDQPAPPRPAPAQPGAAAKPGAIALSKQFFGADNDDMAAAPPPLMPRNVPGSQTVNNTSTINTATNRARQNELLTADSASDGPTGGASDPN